MHKTRTSHAQQESADCFLWLIFVAAARTKSKGKGNIFGLGGGKMSRNGNRLGKNLHGKRIKNFAIKFLRLCNREINFREYLGLSQRTEMLDDWLCFGWLTLFCNELTQECDQNVSFPLFTCHGDFQARTSDWFRNFSLLCNRSWVFHTV